jgi:hypothetical protein
MGWGLWLEMGGPVNTFTLPLIHILPAVYVLRHERIEAVDRNQSMGRLCVSA